jgi:peptide/nickel transport system permease protein
MSEARLLLRRLTPRIPAAVRHASRSWSGRVGISLVGVVVLIAIVGPWASPHSAAQIVGGPFQGPSGRAPLGTDFLGRDTLSRFLHGGGTLVLGGLSATLLAYVVAVPLGIAMGYRRGLFDLTFVGVVDLIISFPAIVVVVVLLAAAGTGLVVAVLAIALIQTPRVVRLIRTLTLEVSTREFVEAAIARGESTATIFWRDILANIWPPLLADFGVRLSGSIIVFSSISYLGLGPPPPAANWGLMISENRTGLLSQPLVVLIPALTIGALAIGVNLAADAVAQSLGRSVVDRGV